MKDISNSFQVMEVQEGWACQYYHLQLHGLEQVIK